MVNLDTYVVNVALPAITESFKSGTANISWIVISYNLMVVSLLLIFGKLGDIIGLKKIFNYGFSIFTTGSLLCGISNSVLMLILSRFVQGIGASILYALPQAMIAKYLPQEKRGMAFGVLASAAALGITLGAPVSGFITEFLSWRWVFFINIPIGILSVILLNYSLSKKSLSKCKLDKFDFIGAILCFFSSLFLTFYINRGQIVGWFSNQMLIILFVSLITFLLFIIRALKCEYSLINLNIFKNINFDFANLSMFLISGYLAATNFLLPFYLSNVLKLSLIQIGILFTSYSLSYLLTSLISGKISNKLPLPYVCSISSFILSLNIIIFIYFINRDYNSYLCPFFIISGITMSFFITSNNNYVMSLANKGEEGMLAGLHRMTGRLGMLFGVAIFEVIYSFTLKSFDELIAYQYTYFVAVFICFCAAIFSLIKKRK